MTMEMVRVATDQRRCALYRHFDENDEGNVDLQIMEYLHQRQVDDLRATAEEYEATVRRFLSLAPADDVKRAEAKALRDYRCAGQDLDDRFPASVLRHVANAIEDRANEVQDDAESEAYLAVVEFAAQRLEAIRDRRLSIAKPPF